MTEQGVNIHTLRHHSGTKQKAAVLAAAIAAGLITSPAARRARCALQSMSDRNYERAPEKHKQACAEAVREHERSLPVLCAHEKGFERNMRTACVNIALGAQETAGEAMRRGWKGTGLSDCWSDAGRSAGDRAFGRHSPYDGGATASIDSGE